MNPFLASQVTSCSNNPQDIFVTVSSQRTFSCLQTLVDKWRQFLKGKAVDLFAKCEARAGCFHVFIRQSFLRWLSFPRTSSLRAFLLYSFELQILLLSAGFSFRAYEVPSCPLASRFISSSIILLFGDFPLVLVRHHFLAVSLLIAVRWGAPAFCPSVMRALTNLKVVM